VISQLVQQIPSNLRESEVVKDLADYGCVTQMHVVRLLAPRIGNENHAKDIDFSADGIRARRAAGYSAAMHALQQAPWEGNFDPIEGVILHEAMPEMPLAAE
jgi:NTE family protein